MIILILLQLLPLEISAIVINDSGLEINAAMICAHRSSRKKKLSKLYINNAGVKPTAPHGRGQRSTRPKSD
jgi:hypothetical protein